MNYTTEIYATHQELSHCNVAFLEFVKDNPACLNRTNFNKILTDNRFTYFKSQPWPTFINSKKKNEMAEAALKIDSLIKSIIPRFLSYDIQRISSYYEIDPDMVSLLLYGVDDNHINNLFGRGDFIATPAGEFKCLEFNMQANLGGWELDLLEPVYTEIPIIAKFLKEYSPVIHKNHFFSLLFEQVLDAFLKKNPSAGNTGGIDEVNLAICYPQLDQQDNYETFMGIRNNYRHILQQKNSKLSGEFIVCGLDSLKMSNSFLLHEGRKIHILVEMLNGLSPFLFMEIVKEGNLLLCNGPVTKLMSNKFNLAFLSEHQDSDIFTPEEREIVKKHIPWTRKVLARDTSFLLSHRETLVLKSSEGLGGNEVFIGCKTSPVEWEQRVKMAVEEKKWVVQEYIPSTCYLYQNGENDCTTHHAIWGLFVLGSRYAGGFVRIMPEKEILGAINSHLGAEESIIIEVDES